MKNMYISFVFNYNDDFCFLNIIIAVNIKDTNNAAKKPEIRPEIVDTIKATIAKVRCLSLSPISNGSNPNNIPTNNAPKINPIK